MDGVVDAAVAGIKAAQQRGVGRVDDRIHLQAGDVPLPDGKLRMCREHGKRVPVNDAFARALGAQQLVLHGQEVRSDRPGRPHVHQAAQQAALGNRVRGKGCGLLPVSGHLLQQDVVQIADFFDFVQSGSPHRVRSLPQLFDRFHRADAEAAAAVQAVRRVDRARDGICNAARGAHTAAALAADALFAVDAVAGRWMDTPPKAKLCR